VPLTGSVPVPTAGLMVTLVAPDVLHVRVELVPELIVAGVA